MAIRAAQAAALAVALLCATACKVTNGAIFAHITQPLDVNFDRTPVHDRNGSSDWHRLKYRVQADWGRNGLGDIAKQHGLEQIYYADLETLSILGIYTKRRVHVYGESPR